MFFGIKKVGHYGLNENFTLMNGTITTSLLQTNLEKAVEYLFDFIKVIITDQEDKLNKKGSKFNTIEKQKDGLATCVGVISFTLQKLTEDVQREGGDLRAIKETLFKKFIAFEKEAQEYENSLKHISGNTKAFYGNINGAIHDTRMEIVNCMQLLSLTEDGKEVDYLDEVLINFSDAFQAYLNSRAAVSSPEYYKVHKTIFDEAYKMIHYAMMLAEIEHFLNFPSHEIVSNDLRLVCARLQGLCRNQDFIVARDFVKKLFDLKIDNMEFILSNNSTHRAELKLEMLEYILLPKYYPAKFCFNGEIKRANTYYLIRRLHKERWVKKDLMEALNKNRFYIKDGHQNPDITYAALTALLNNHDMKKNDQIDPLFT